MVLLPWVFEKSKKKQKKPVQIELELPLELPLAPLPKAPQEPEEDPRGVWEIQT
jgi:hypothetical protein